MFEKEGIFQRSTCPHSSQQNGARYPHHRRIVKKVLAFLLRKGVPKPFRCYAFKTSSYLLNRISSKVINYILLYRYLVVFSLASVPIIRTNLMIVMLSVFF